MRSFLEEKLYEYGLDLTQETITADKGPLKNIPFKQSIYVPENCIVVHPVMMAKLLNNAVDADIAVEFLIKKG